MELVSSLKIRTDGGGRLRKKLRGRGKGRGNVGRKRERRGEKEKGEEEGKGKGRGEEGKRKGKERKGGGGGREEMKDEEGGTLTYSVFEHILGIKFQQAVFPCASEASRGEAVEVFLGLFCPDLR